MNRLGSDRR